jgi:hypothetical protein
VSASWASLAGMEGTVVGHGCLLAFFLCTHVHVIMYSEEKTSRSTIYYM